MTKPWPADKIERWPISRLTPYTRNARLHPAHQIAAIANSIQHWGWTMPILVDETGRLIAGHARLLAAKKLRLKDVPVMIATGWSEADKKAYTIADTKLAEPGTFDNDMLVMELGEIATSDFDITLTGFDAGSISTLLAPPAFDDDDDEEIDEGGRGKAPSIIVSVPNEIDIPSVAAILRKALKASGYRGVKVRESVDAGSR